MGKFEREKVIAARQAVSKPQGNGLRRMAFVKHDSGVRVFMEDWNDRQWPLELFKLFE